MLRHADLTGTHFQRARYNRDTMWPAGFDARNSGAIGPEAQLHRANLRDVDLHNVDLHDADLHEADLRQTRLSGANLRRVNLRGADLSGANLCQADLRDADLNGAILQGARYTEETKWPVGFSAQDAGMVLEGSNNPLAM